MLRRKTIKRLTENSRVFHTVVYKPRFRHSLTGHSLENIQNVGDSVKEEPDTFIRHRAQELSLSRTVLHNILTKDLQLFP